MKKLVEDVYKINSREAGKVIPKHESEGFIELGIEGIGIQTIKIISTNAQFGGYLRWFSCPHCNTMVGTLYLPYSQTAFLCRHCYDLGYRQQFNRFFRKT
ncbi:MAG: hypothetical protein GY853_14275 [PVC group bacterium]|nr:hypothetical protein [PVC group bacterium]